MEPYRLELHCGPISEATQVAALNLMREVLELQLGGSDGVMRAWREAGLANAAESLNLMEPSAALMRWLAASGEAVSVAVRAYAPRAPELYEDMWLELIPLAPNARDVE